MYTKGLDAAFVIGFLAAAPIVLWMAWWLIAGLGERVSGTPAHHWRSGPGFHS